MKIINGTSVYDYTQGATKCPNELYTNIHSIPDLALLMDGTTSNQDAVHKIAATMGGGVGGAWTEESNWQNLLAARAPVIAEATDNVLPNNAASLEDGTTGGWVAVLNATIANSSLQSWHGGKSLLHTNTAGGASQVRYDASAVTANAQYTVSAKFKGTAGVVYRMALEGNVSGLTTSGNFTATGNWQLAYVTATFAGDAIRRIYLIDANGAAGNTVYWDAIQLEQKAYATPFALDSRTASTLTFPTASLGLTAGQDLSIVVVTRTPWAGNDGVLHYLFDNRDSVTTKGLAIYKLNTNILSFAVQNDPGAANYRIKGIAVNAANWPTDTPHVIIATITSVGGFANMNIYLNNVAGAVDGGGTYAGRETAFGTSYIGTSPTGTSPANAPLFVAMYSRILSANEISLLSRMQAWCQKMKGF